MLTAQKPARTREEQVWEQGAGEGIGAMQERGVRCMSCPRRAGPAFSWTLVLHLGVLARDEQADTRLCSRLKALPCSLCPRRRQDRCTERRPAAQGSAPDA